MDLAALLVELFGRIPPLAAEAVDGLGPDDLATVPGPDANPVGWLVWHLTWVWDHHLAQAFGLEQLYLERDWAARFGRDARRDDTGYGHGADDVAALRADGDALLGYLDAVAARSVPLLAAVRPGELDRVVDEGYDPPVTLGVRLVSVAVDCLEHCGQAAYAWGLIDR